MSWSLAEALGEAGASGLLVLAESSRDPDIAPFVGSVHLGKTLLILGRSSAPKLGFLTPMERAEAAATGLELMAPSDLEVEAARAEHGPSPAFWSAILERALELSGLEQGTVALGGRMALGSGYSALRALEEKGWRFIDGRTLLLRHRKRKTQSEITAIRRSAAGVCAAFHRVAEVLATAHPWAGKLRWNGRALSVGVLRREIAIVLGGHGLGQPEGNIVAPGAVGAVPHSKGDDEMRLRVGDTIVVDLFPKGELFADCTRTFWVGEPPAPARRAFDCVRRALEVAHRTATPGCRLRDLQEATCTYFAEVGYQTPLSRPGTVRGYVHGLGHGVGYELHEQPSFSAGDGDEGVLEPGDVFTLEPGLYDPDVGFGIRLEDLCLATETGLENLTPLPYEPDPWAWSGAPGTRKLPNRALRRARERDGGQ